MKQIANILQLSHQKIVGNRRNFENQILINFCKRFAKSDSAILDVGCGLGHNMSLLKSQGFTNVVGTDISKEMLIATSAKGHIVAHPEELNKYTQHFDVILFSHVLEHIEYRDIQKMLESYFDLAKTQAHVIICMPLLYDGFYHDVDHIKPYYPKGLTALFSRISVPKQYESNYHLELVDIRYVRASLLPYHLRSRHIRSVVNYLLLGLLAFLFFMLRVVTFGLASKAISYVAVFKLNAPIQHSQK